MSHYREKGLLKNIISLRNKCEFLVEFIRGKADILMTSETKI